MKLVDFIAKLQEYPPDATFEEVWVGGHVVTHFNDSRDVYSFHYDRKRNVMILADSDSINGLENCERVFDVKYGDVKYGENDTDD